jgi:hypothetical protein
MATSTVQHLDLSDDTVDTTMHVLLLAASAGGEPHRLLSGVGLDMNEGSDTNQQTPAAVSDPDPLLQHTLTLAVACSASEPQVLRMWAFPKPLPLVLLHCMLQFQVQAAARWHQVRAWRLGAS